MTEVGKIVTNLSILRQKSLPISEHQIVDLKLHKRLRATNTTAWTKGCGLAAIQIGIPLRYAWFTHNGKEYELVNPVILKTWGEAEESEGCLSIVGKQTKVKRAVTIEYLSRGKKYTVSGFIARVIQHEIDHMDGILNIDRGSQEMKDEH